MGCRTASSRRPGQPPPKRLGRPVRPAGRAGRRGWLIVQGGWEPRVRAGGESKRPRAGNASPMCSAICAPGLRFGSQLQRCLGSTTPRRFCTRLQPCSPWVPICSFPVCCGQVGGLSGGHDGGQEAAGWGRAAGSRTPCREWCGWRAAHACTSCPLDTPTTSILLAFARGLRSERGPRRVPVHYRQRTRFCLCVRRSSPYVVAVRARITRRLAPVYLPTPVYAAQL